MANMKVKSSKAIDLAGAVAAELPVGEISTESPFICDRQTRAILYIEPLSPNRRHYETF
jgi:hypothetical protein